MRNMKLKTKLILGFLIVAIITTIVAVVGIVGITSTDNTYTKTIDDQFKPLPVMSKVIEFTQRLRVQARNLVLNTGDATALEPVISDVNSRLSSLEQYMDEYEQTIVDPNAAGLFTKAKDAYYNEFKPIIQELIAGAQAGKSIDEMKTILDKALAPTDLMVSSFDQCSNIKVEAGQKASDEATNLANTVLAVMIIVSVLGVAIAMVLGVFISRMISRPVIRMEALMSQVGTTGNLSIEPSLKAQLDQDTTAKDEIGASIRALKQLIVHITEVSDALKTIAERDLSGTISVLSQEDVLGISLTKMQDNLNEMLSEINLSTSQVSTGAKQIADGAQALAQGSTEQGAAVEQLSSSVSEVAQKTQENAAKAGKAAELSASIKNNAQKGSGQMDQMMQAVREINEASLSINKVIKVIDDIAFQTNILALNAAVEAARAGQHGKGFAVVAEEVRNLAAKSAEAAKDTGVLIANSMEKATLGAKIAEETSASLSEIVTGINESTAIIADIAQSSEEQATAINQINIGIDQVAQVVQQNSATAEESAAASEEMSGQSNMLEELVAQFKLRGGDSRSKPATLGSSSQGSSSAPRKQLSMPAKPSDYNAGDFGKY